MEIRKHSTLAKLYKGPEHPICWDYAELKLICAAAKGDAASAEKLFKENKFLRADRCVIDAPYRRYEGLDGVRAFAEEFLPTFHAECAEVIPVVQTRAGGRSVTELQVDFVVDGMIEQVPMFVVADLRAPELLDEVRIYCHCSFVPDLQAYRKPMFSPAHLEVGDPDHLSGAVREYFYALHKMPNADVERIVECCQPDCLFSGYSPVTKEEYDCAGWPVTKDELEINVMHIRAKFERLAKYIPSGVAVRYETVIDDGKTAVIEWVHIVSERGQKEFGRLAMSGIAAYERGEEGLLRSIRINDYAKLEHTIDWSKTGTTLEEAKKLHYVPQFHANVGKNFIDDSVSF